MCVGYVRRTQRTAAYEYSFCCFIIVILYARLVYIYTPMMMMSMTRQGFWPERRSYRRVSSTQGSDFRLAGWPTGQSMKHPRRVFELDSFLVTWECLATYCRAAVEVTCNGCIIIIVWHVWAYKETLISFCFGLVWYWALGRADKIIWQRPHGRRPKL